MTQALTPNELENNTTIEYILIITINIIEILDCSKRIYTNHINPLTGLFALYHCSIVAPKVIYMMYSYNIEPFMLMLHVICIG